MATPVLLDLQGVFLEGAGKSVRSLDFFCRDWGEIAKQSDKETCCKYPQFRGILQ
jgi:hypothetical protein